MWNNGKSQLPLPIEIIQEPDKEWGARKRDQNHLKVKI